MTDAQKHFLDVLLDNFDKLNSQEHFRTDDFVVACTSLLPIFDGLGSLFASFPKADLQDKANSLHTVQDELVLLEHIVEADKKAGTITTKGSKGRNLQRLIIIQDFVRHIFVNMTSDKGIGFSKAVSSAYDVSLGKIHTWAVRTGIKTGMYLLPNTQQFLKSINETEESGMAKGVRLVELATPVVERLYKLYDGIEMPGSDMKFLPK